MGDVLVVGSINADLVTRVRRRPDPGETVLADAVSVGCGGKGANQAVASARAGARTAMVGAVGDDEWGRLQLAALATAGVDVTGVAVVAGCPTGFAAITVTPDGENAIVVASGANAHVRAGAGPDADVIVAQTEIPIAAVIATARLAADRGARLVLNLAPVVPLDTGTLAAADPLVVNETEARQLAGAGSTGSLDDIAHHLRTRCRSLVITLGRSGALLLADEAIRVPAPEVTVVDSTGAGDVLVGTLAAALADGAGLPDAVRRAVSVAAQVVTRRGAR